MTDLGQRHDAAGVHPADELGGHRGRADLVDVTVQDRPGHTHFLEGVEVPPGALRLRPRDEPAAAAQRRLERHVGAEAEADRAPERLGRRLGEGGVHEGRAGGVADQDRRVVLGQAVPQLGGAGQLLEAPGGVGARARALEAGEERPDVDPQDERALGLQPPRHRDDTQVPAAVPGDEEHDLGRRTRRRIDVDGAEGSERERLPRAGGRGGRSEGRPPRHGRCRRRRRR